MAKRISLEGIGVAALSVMVEKVAAIAPMIIRCTVAVADSIKSTGG
jgi:hypothetical protein